MQLVGLPNTSISTDQAQKSPRRSSDQMQYCISTSRTNYTPLHLNCKAKKRHLRSHGCWSAMSSVLQVRELECCWWSMNFGVPPATFTLHSTTNQFRYICCHHRIQLSASTITISTHPWPRQDILLRLEMGFAQYTSATLRRALTTENTIRFFAQCVQEDVLGNQDMITQMCTNCNSVRALHQILSSSKKIATAGTLPRRRDEGSGWKLNQRNT